MQDIYFAEFFLGFCHHFFHRVFVGEVEGHGIGFNLKTFFDGGHCGFGIGQVKIGGYDGGAVLSQTGCKMTPQYTASTGHYRYFVFEAETSAHISNRLRHSWLPFHSLGFAKFVRR
ncbi:MAG: hypothetical protein BWY75_01457 [bacterium ADurb.Bin425]|nr:MAG: hypothetical protein BWY75_01457 [bacterium ADurb.Bin425]